jgi:hypothetical protein
MLVVAALVAMPSTAQSQVVIIIGNGSAQPYCPQPYPLRCEAIGDGAEHDGWSGSTTRGLVNPADPDFELTEGSRRFLMLYAAGRLRARGLTRVM